jgi:chemotaxis signal transduction protein
MYLGIAADAVEGVRPVDLSGLAPVPLPVGDERTTLLRGLTDDLVGILDLRALARDPRIRVEHEA